MRIFVQVKEVAFWILFPVRSAVLSRDNTRRREGLQFPFLKAFIPLSDMAFIPGHLISIQKVLLLGKQAWGRITEYTVLAVFGLEPSTSHAGISLFKPKPPIH